MALKTALIIDGNSEGGKRALAEFEGQLEQAAQAASQLGSEGVKASVGLERLRQAEEAAARAGMTLTQEQRRAAIQGRELVIQQAAASQQIQRTTASAGMQRAGMQQLSMQLNDVATMFAMGARPQQIFASQIGQVTQAVQMMTGGTSRLAGFMAGPWGMAITTATVVLSPFIARLFDTENALDRVGDAAEEAMDKLRQSLSDVSNFQAAIDANQSKLLNGMGELARSNREIAQVTRMMNELVTQPGGAQAMEGLAARLARLEADKASAEKDIREARANFDEIRSLHRVEAMQERNRDHLTARPERERRAARDRRSGPSIEDIERRFDDQLIGYTQQSLSAMQQLASSAEERAELEMRSVEWSRRQTLASIAADEHYNAVQKADLVTAVESLTNHQRELVEFRKRTQLEQEAHQLADLRHDVALDALDAQMELVETEAERKSLALQIFDAETAYLRAKLEAIAASEVATQAEKQRAQVELQALNATAAARREGVSRANATSVERYLRELHQTPAEIGEAIDRIKIDGLEALNDELTETIGNVLKVGGVFGDVANQIIADLIRIGVQRAIIGPLANMLFPGAGSGPENLLPGGGGGIFGTIARLFGGGRADGGPVSPGQFYAVNERSTAPGLFFPIGPGRIEPAGADGARSMPPIVLQLRATKGEMFDIEVERISGNVAVQTVQGYAPAIVEASAAETTRRLVRPRM